MGDVLWSHHWVLNVTKWSIVSGQLLGNVMMSSISVSASQFHYSLSSLWTWADNMRAPGRNSTRADKNKRATNNRTQNSKFIYNVINLSLFSDWTNKQNYASLAVILINKNLHYVFQPSSKSYLQHLLASVPKWSFTKQKKKCTSWWHWALTSWWQYVDYWALSHGTYASALIKINATICYRIVWMQA